MIQRDFIMRIVEQFARVLSKILGLKATKQYQEALLVIEQAFQQFLGLNSKFINSLSYKDLIAIMKLGEFWDTSKCVMLADLLKEEGDIYDAQNNLDESYKRYLKSLNIFLETLMSNDKTKLQDYFSKIDTIVNKLKKYRLPTGTNYELFRYYERIGKYSKAEDLLFELIEINHSKNNIVKKGISFYKRLMRKNDSELIKGNLPRDETKEGLARLKEIKKKLHLS